MNAKLIRYTIYMTLLPLSGVLWAAALRHDSASAIPMLLMMAALQLSALLLFRRSLEPFIHPDTAVLKKMGVAYVPIAYQPGRFKADTRVFSFGMYLSLLPPILMWLACQFFQRVEVGVIQNFSYTAPNMNLMLAGFFTLILGALSLPLWFHAARAAVIYAEGSEQKRYLIRGFVDTLDQKGGLTAYLDGCKGIFHTPGMNGNNAYYWITH